MTAVGTGTVGKMSKHRSFKPSDFSLRDIPGFIVAYIIISLFSIGLGLLIEALPEFWSGILVGAGFAMLGTFLQPGRQNNVSQTEQR